MVKGWTGVIFGAAGIHRHGGRGVRIGAAVAFLAAHLGVNGAGKLALLISVAGRAIYGVRVRGVAPRGGCRNDHYRDEPSFSPHFNSRKRKTIP